jgi:hypothetical protein
MTEINPVPTPAPTKTPLPIKTIIISIILIAYGIFEFYRFTKFENGGESMTVYSYEIPIYNYTGKFGILIVCILIAIGLIAYHYWSNRKK